MLKDMHQGFFSKGCRPLFTLIAIQLTLSLTAQNLVPNPSFEEYKITDGEKVIACWTGCLKNDTPDFFDHSEKKAAEMSKMQIKSTLTPLHGNSFAGIFCYRNDPIANYEDVREFLQVSLIKPLIEDSIYEVSLSIALEPESNIALKQLHIVFSENRIRLRREKNAFELSPDIVIEDDFIVNHDWKTFHLKYKAKGGENYLLIGNLLNDAKSRKTFIRSVVDPALSKWKMNKEERVAYYYFDEIVVILPQDEISDYDNVPAAQEDQTETELVIDIQNIRPDSLILLKNVYFETDRYEILDASYPELNRLLKFMKENLAVRIFIEGHTDNTGTNQYNQELSEQRARSVAEFLFSNDIGPERISMAGYGADRPVGDNSTVKGREMNRRVGFRITAK
jgi:OmpA-OmpF porin, OOP family